MIKYHIGDLTKAPEKVLIHGCNAQGVMGSGVAKAIRDEFPEAYIYYNHIYKTSGLSLGKILWVYTNKKWIANAITQEYYGRDGKRYVSYDAIEKIMIVINTIPLEYDIAMSMIGANLGGGNWNIISSIIENTCTNRDINVYCFEKDYEKWSIGKK